MSAARALAFGLLWSLPLWAEPVPRYILADGAVLEADQVQRRNGYLVERLTLPTDEGTAERMHRIDDVVRLEWPEPAALAQARQCLTGGAPLEAVAALEPVVQEFAPFAQIEGSWWGDAALLQAQGWLAAGRAAEATPLVQALLARETREERRDAARLLFVEIDLHEGRHALAAAMLDQLVADHGVGATQEARVWLLRGEIFLQRRDYENALQAFLRLPALHWRDTTLRPAALLGAARGYRGFGDRPRAEHALHELIRAWPAHPLAARAREELAATVVPP